MTYLVHYGVSKRDGAEIGSGRYPLGSGENPNQRPSFTIDSYDRMRKEGMSEAEAAKALGYESIYRMREHLTTSRAERKQWTVTQAIKLYEDRQWSKPAICKELGISRNTLDAYLDPTIQNKASKQERLVQMLKDSVDANGAIDVGSGVHYHIGVPKNRLDAAVRELDGTDGYRIHTIFVEQMGTGKETRVKVLAKDDEEHSFSQLKRNPDLIQPVAEYTTDGGEHYQKTVKPVDISSDRVTIRYAEDGGTDRDGVIELRRGVDDISLGNSSYAQVRISVDGTHYLKGMAVYSDDLPAGCDIRFNTNKSKSVPMMSDDKDNTVLKKQKDSETNPFGASVHQYKYKDADGNEHLSAINKVNDEGNWSNTWSKSLSSQFLSKQTPELARRQLSNTLTEMQADFDDIKTLTNPAVKKKLLEDFAEECDGAAVHLKASAMPRQGWHVLLPSPDIPEDKCYAPNYHDGERVVLVRYPHGGRFEIPELTVSSKEEMKSARELVGNNPIDAIVVHPKVAARLSGADFDGDTVIVIPNNDGAIKTKPALKGLEGYEPKIRYKAYEGMPRVGKEDGFDTQKQMGRVSNLITDMTIKGATDDELARAVRHSMTVIDAEKHNLDWRTSEKDNRISELKEKYQGGANRGASTIISKASSEARVDQRTEGAYIIDPVTGEQSKTKYKFDPVTGDKLYTYTGKTYFKPSKKDDEGNILAYKEVKKTQKSTKMAEAHDARELSSGYEIEEVYAAHANALKDLARQARLEANATPGITSDSEARKKYKAEVDELNAALHKAEMNAPLERRAQILAGAMLKAEKADNPGMDADDIKKARGRLLTQARAEVGAGKTRIKITDRQWEAMQAGALSTKAQLKIFANSDKDTVRKLARPKDRTSLTPAQIALAKQLLANEATQADVAERFGVSTSTLMNLVRE